MEKKEQWFDPLSVYAVKQFLNVGWLGTRNHLHHALMKKMSQIHVQSPFSKLKTHHDTYSSTNRSGVHSSSSTVALTVACCEQEYCELL